MSKLFIDGKEIHNVDWTDVIEIKETSSVTPPSINTCIKHTWIDHVIASQKAALIVENEIDTLRLKFCTDAILKDDKIWSDLTRMTIECYEIHYSENHETPVYAFPYESLMYYSAEYHASIIEMLTVHIQRVISESCR